MNILEEIKQDFIAYNNSLWLDSKTSKFEWVKDYKYGNSESSILITQTKLNKEGISCDQWFTEKEFLKRFTKELKH